LECDAGVTRRGFPVKSYTHFGPERGGALEQSNRLGKSAMSEHYEPEEATWKLGKYMREASFLI